MLRDAKASLDSEDYIKAGKLIDSALRENSTSLMALTLKTEINLRTKKYDEAIDCSRRALNEAELLCKRESIARARYQLSMAYFKTHKYAESFDQIMLASKYAEKDNEIMIFKEMVTKKYQTEADLTEEQIKQEEAKYDHSKQKSQVSTPTVKSQMRTDWYDGDSVVDISIFVKSIDKKSVAADFEPNSFKVEFMDTKGEKYNYAIPKLYNEIVPDECEYAVFSTKLEITLAKSKKLKWTNLKYDESKDKRAQEVEPTMQSYDNSEAVTSYPSSSNKKVDWSKYEGSDEDEANEEAGDDAALNFFQKLYSDADPDTKRAMMKSYVESNGTSLSTDWSEVAKKEVETQAPEGTVPKQWSK
ncbi:hypothetical protein FOA43_003814 [Brettanomyces nanus]|uniref:Uncharacterized protein n=1 Tax=Eeniella nana TaxID=13502 RepID=A0A875S871_EENNA|nr:uncharacterized protein FOA43_003814 [Brettanomyces nanus]QPG76425.1 hypothetical protein FOA43_003814 [Brettanomyces nanus]